MPYLQEMMLLDEEVLGYEQGFSMFAFECLIFQLCYNFVFNYLSDTIHAIEKNSLMKWYHNELVEDRVDEFQMFRVGT